jgi:hypothetical protein
VNANIAKWPSAKSYDTKTIAKAQEIIEIIETTRNPHEGVGVKGDIPYQHAGVSVFGLMLRVGRRHICFSIHIYTYSYTHTIYIHTCAEGREARVLKRAQGRELCV